VISQKGSANVRETKQRAGNVLGPAGSYCPSGSGGGRGIEAGKCNSRMTGKKKMYQDQKSGLFQKRGGPVQRSKRHTIGEGVKRGT